MKFKYLIFFLLFLELSTLSAQYKNQNYINYISKYSELAVKQQIEFGIPASITLAQGLLESGAGLSQFVLNSKNHFGIKCHDWTGDKVYHDDDATGECFRKYNDVYDSYRDHSLFLKSKPRYAFLFNYSTNDYESWAYGLKKAGYATDPAYAYKLIAIIENYELSKFDSQKSDNKANAVNNPEKPNTLNSPIGKIQAYTTHQVYKTNGVKFIVTENGDTFESIAEEFNISEKRIRIYNDLSENFKLKPRIQLYIGRKKSKVTKGSNLHVVKSGESMYEISQNYAIRIEKLYELNNMDYTEIAKIGMVLKLR